MAEPTDFMEMDGDVYDPQAIQEYEEKLAQGNGEATDEVRSMLGRRRLAYTRVFSGKAQQGDVDVVLCDLMWFCKAWIPSYDIKDGMHAEELSKRKEGRKEVFMRIKDFSCLDNDTLLMKYTDAVFKGK